MNTFAMYSIRCKFQRIEIECNGDAIMPHSSTQLLVLYTYTHTLTHMNETNQIFVHSLQWKMVLHHQYQRISKRIVLRPRREFILHGDRKRGNASSECESAANNGHNYVRFGFNTKGCWVHTICPQQQARTYTFVSSIAGKWNENKHHS